MSEQATTTDPAMPEAKLNLVRPNAPVTPPLPWMLRPYCTAS